ncbi:uncharacterized, partial [Tachysurus ichikawai]
QSNLEARSAERLLHSHGHNHNHNPASVLSLIHRHLQRHCLCETISFPQELCMYGSGRATPDTGIESHKRWTCIMRAVSLLLKENSVHFPPKMLLQTNTKLAFELHPSRHRVRHPTCSLQTHHDPVLIPDYFLLRYHHHEHLKAMTHASSLRSRFPLQTRIITVPVCNTSSQNKKDM